MANLTAANLARLDTVLDRTIRVDGLYTSWRHVIESGPEKRYWFYYVDLTDKWAIVDNDQPLNRVVQIVGTKAEAESLVSGFNGSHDG